jgi:alpha-1,6-mannosyltransferase
MRLIVPGDRDSVESHGNYGRIYRVRGRVSTLSPGYRVILPVAYLLPRSRVREILAEERPHLVECCDKYTLTYLAGLLRRGWFGIPAYRPAVVGLTCERMDDNVAGYVSSGRLARAFCRWYMQWLYFPMFDHHIAVSPHTAGELHQASFGHRKRRGVWVRPMGADCRLFTPARRSWSFRQWLASRTGAPESAAMLLYAGRLAPEKNVLLLIETMRLLEQHHTGRFHLLIAGKGALRAGLEQLCDRELPGAVHFLGHLRDRETLADIYANCDALLHPNPREPFGIAPLEAMASGLPVIAPDSGGITSYANAGNALLVEPDPHAFAGAASMLRRRPCRAAALRKAGRATAESLDWPAVASSYFALYDELCAVVQGAHQEPAIAPAFYSTYPGIRRRFGWES